MGISDFKGIITRRCSLYTTHVYYNYLIEHIDYPFIN